MYYPLYCCTIHHTVTIATELSHLHDLFNNSNDIGPIQQKRILLKIKQHASLFISMYINNRMHASTSFIHAQYIFLHDDYVQGLLTLSVQMNWSSFFCDVRVDQSFVFCYCFIVCFSLFFLLVMVVCVLRFAFFFSLTLPYLQTFM